MRTQDYIEAHPGRGEFISVANFVAPVPALPHSINTRRRDVFESYREQIQKTREARPVQAFTARLSNVLLATGGGNGGAAVRTDDGILLDDLFSHGETPPARLDPNAARHLTGSAAVILEEGAGHNYYRWLLTALPKLLLLMKGYARHCFDHIIVNDSHTRYVRQTLDFLGVPAAAIVSAAQYPVLRLDDAVFARLHSGGVYPHALLPEIFREVFPRYLYQGRRIWISRAGTRVVANEADIIDTLCAIGFEPVRLETLSVAEQIQLFSSAQCVAGPHGAGMSNLIFCPPHTKVLEIFAPRYVNPAYWYLAQACGHEFHYLMAPGEDPPLAGRDWCAGDADNVTIDLEQLRAAVAALKLEPHAE
jgi:capsular polysaccharide biosynthesis protein